MSISRRWPLPVAADGREFDALDNGVDAITVAPGYEYNNAYFVYNAETGKYTRYQYGDVQTDLSDRKCTDL